MTCSACGGPFTQVDGHVIVYSRIWHETPPGQAGGPPVVNLLCVQCANDKSRQDTRDD